MGTNTPVSAATIVVTVNATNDLSLDPEGGDLTLSPGLDTITFNLENANPAATVRFTNASLNPPEPDPFYVIRSAGPADKLGYTRNSDAQLTVTNDNRNHPKGQDWMYKYGIRVAVTNGGTTTILVYDPTIDDEDEE